MPTESPFFMECNSAVILPAFIMVNSIFSLAPGSEEGVKGPLSYRGIVNSINCPAAKEKFSFGLKVKVLITEVSS